jgi:hypothetical protein
MPFGRYRGQLLSDVPTDYLRWCWRTCDLSPWLRHAIEGELTRRCGSRPEPDPSASGAEAGALVRVRTAVQAWFREMALRYHPDRTLDDGAAMKVINHAHERLRELLGVP